MRYIALGSLLALLLLGTAAQVAAQTAQPTLTPIPTPTVTATPKIKTVACAEQIYRPLPRHDPTICCAPTLLEIVLPKGLKKTWLLVNAQMSAGQEPPNSANEWIALTVTVNGHNMAPDEVESGFIYEQCFAGRPYGASCTLNGTYGINLDQKEAQFPGEFIGVPLHIRLDGGPPTQVSANPPQVGPPVMDTNGYVKMCAHMVKK